MLKKTIGYISYTHGLDGKVKIVPSVSKEKFEEYLMNNQIILDDDNHSILSIKIFAFTGKVFLCKIDGISSIEMAKKIIKHEIFVEVPKNSNVIDPESLIDFDVFLVKSEDGNERKNKIKYGKVIDYGNYGAGDLIEIETKNGKREFFLCNSDVIVDIDVKKKSITINDWYFN